jgi:hypothetical protein
MKSMQQSDHFDGGPRQEIPDFKGADIREALQLITSTARPTGSSRKNCAIAKWLE